jgi:hypothetical protein
LEEALAITDLLAEHPGAQAWITFSAKVVTHINAVRLLQSMRSLWPTAQAWRQSV